MTAVLTAGPTTGQRQTELRLVEWLVVGGALVAPLNLLIVRSFTAYDLLIGAALLVLWRNGRLQMPSRRYLVLPYVFMLAALLSSFRATYAIEAMTQILQYAFIFFVQIPVVLSVVRTRRLAVTSIALICVGTLAAVLHAYIFQPTQGSGRVVVFYSENPNRLGYPTAYLMPFLIVLWHLSRSTTRLKRIGASLGCLAGGFLAVWALFASGSRSSLLGTFAALLVFVVLRPGHGVLRMVGRGLVLVSVVGVLGFGLYNSGQLPPTLEERVTRSMSADAEDQAHLVGDREHLADAAVNAFVSHPYLGTGLDNFRYVTTDYNLFATPQLPHNLWLQLLVQVGLFGTLAFAGYLLVWFRDMVAAFRRAVPVDAELLWSLVAAMAGILTIFMFAPEMLDRHYWLLAALGLAIARGSARQNHGKVDAP